MVIPSLVYILRAHPTVIPKSGATWGSTAVMMWRAQSNMGIIFNTRAI